MELLTFNETFRMRTKELALAVLAFYRTLRKVDETRIMGKQLIRCCTSVGANFRASCRARSKAERYAKLCIVVEEADEVLFWLELIQEAGFASSEKIRPIYNEALEILKVMSQTRKKLKSP